MSERTALISYVSRTRFLVVMLLAVAAVPFIVTSGRTASVDRQPNSVRQAMQEESTARFHKTAKPVKDQYIVVLRPDTNEQDVKSLARNFALTYSGKTKHIYKHAIKGFSIQTTEAAAIAMSQDPQVAYVEEDAEVELAATQSNPPSWGLDRIDQHDLPLSSTYNFSNGETGVGVNVYVIDSGIKTQHTEFKKPNGGWRVVNDFDSYNDGQIGNDCNGHGTFIAGVIGGNTVGVAKDATLHNIRVAGCANNSASASTVIAGIDWVAAHRVLPAVANLSFVTDVNYSLEDSVRNLIGWGVTCVVAAGNNGVDAKDKSPARVSEAITVSSSDANDGRSSGANFGPFVDLFAPGTGIVSASNLDRNGNGVLDDTTVDGGTSVAAAHVTGVVARFLQEMVQHEMANVTPAAVQGAIKNCATPDKLFDAGAGSPNLLLYSGVRASSGTIIPPINSPITVPGNSADWVPTGIIVRKNSWLAFNADGWVATGGLFSAAYQPQGKNDIANNSSFPLPGTRPYSLLGRFLSSTLNVDNFYIGPSFATPVFQEDVEKQLFLRANMDSPSSASGQFTAQIQMWFKGDDVSSDFVTQTVPATVLAGQQMPVSITMKNVGTTTWQQTGHEYALTTDPFTGGLWGGVFPPLPSDVAPGSQVTFNFNVTAPSTPGTYNFQWRVRNNWGLLGDRTDNVSVTVLAPSNQAEFVSQTVPASMTGGEAYTVTIKMKNIGNTTWDAGTGYKLGSQNPQDNTRWGTSRAELASPVAPGGIGVFTFVVWAPGKAGSYNFQWRMLREGVEWFGPSTPNLVISVKNPPCMFC